MVLRYRVVVQNRELGPASTCASSTAARERGKGEPCVRRSAARRLSHEASGRPALLASAISMGSWRAPRPARPAPARVSESRRRCSRTSPAASETTSTAWTSAAPRPGCSRATAMTPLPPLPRSRRERRRSAAPTRVVGIGTCTSTAASASRPAGRSTSFVASWPRPSSDPAPTSGMDRGRRAHGLAPSDSRSGAPHPTSEASSSSAPPAT